MKPVVFGFGAEGARSATRKPGDGGAGPALVAAPVGQVVVAPSSASRAAPSVLGIPQRGSSLGNGEGRQSIHAGAEDEEFLVGLKRRWSALVADLARPEQRSVLLTIAVLVGLLLYSYLPALRLASIAWSNAQYAHGWIVPLFSGAILFWWREPAKVPVPISARAVGLALLAASFGLRLLVASYRIVTIDMYTFVPAMVGIFLLAGGWSMLRWAWAPLLFLIFMFPLPDEATRYLLGPLQTIATSMSTFALQTLGLEAYREGNQINIGEMKLGVVDACSGLRMLTIFCALAVGLVMVGKRNWWENGVILASAIPIALIVNSIRITITGLLFQVADSEFAERVFHDWAGMVMMPIAMAMLYFEQYLLANIFLPESDTLALVPGGEGAVPGASKPLPAGKPVSDAPIVGADAGSAKAGGAPRPRTGPDANVVVFPFGRS